MADDKTLERERPTVSSVRPGAVAPDDLPDGSRPGWRRSRWTLIGSVLMGSLSVLVLAIIILGDDTSTPSDGQTPPLVRADPRPVKVAPEDPGGLEVPDRDKLVYRRLRGEVAPEGVESLLPEPEKPVLPVEPPAEPDMAEAEEPMASSAAMPDEALPPVEDGPAMSEEAPADAPDETAMAPESVSTETPADLPPARPAPPPHQVAQSAQGAASSSTAIIPPSPAKPAAAAGPSFQVQLAATRTAEQAQAAWQRLSSENRALLGGLAPSVQRVDLGDKGVLHRLRAGPLASESAARSLCQALGQRQVACLVVHAGG